MQLRLFSQFFNRLYPCRWLASIALLFLVDIATYMAFTRSGGTQVVANQDKVLHVIGFFGLTLAGHVSLVYDFFPKVKPRSLLLMVVNVCIWIGYGVFIEVVQHFLNYRSSSLGDLAADGLGIALAVFCAYVTHLYPRSTLPHGQTQES